MKGIALSILFILLSLALGASGGIAVGSFVSPDVESNVSTNPPNNVSQLPSTPSLSSGDGSINANRTHNIVDDIAAVPNKNVSPIQTSPSSAQNETLKPSTAQVDIGTPTIRRQSASLLSNGDVVQVSNQIPSNLITGTCGDSNADGVFNVGDVVTGLQVLAGLKETTRYHQIFSDLNGDESLNILDFITALQRLVSQNPNLNECGPFADQ